MAVKSMNKGGTIMNLKNPNKGIDYIHYMSGEQLCAEREFEHGADAMLEGLKKKGDRLQGQKRRGYIWDQSMYGWLVFIPEEQ